MYQTNWSAKLNVHSISKSTGNKSNKYGDNNEYTQATLFPKTIVLKAFNFKINIIQKKTKHDTSDSEIYQINYISFSN